MIPIVPTYNYTEYMAVIYGQLTLTTTTQHILNRYAWSTPLHFTLLYFIQTNTSTRLDNT